jgi:hypothetical protein
MLSAVGCKDCQARVAVDRQAVAEAQRRHVPAWNILVYANQDVGHDFVDRFHPAADRILLDPTADVAVGQLGGSDATCWLAIDGQGRVQWQGPGTVPNIPKALDSVAAWVGYTQ